MAGGKSRWRFATISLASSLPLADAALSISSGYEAFLTQIRNRIWVVVWSSFVF